MHFHTNFWFELLCLVIYRQENARKQLLRNVYDVRKQQVGENGNLAMHDVINMSESFSARKEQLRREQFELEKKSLNHLVSAEIALVEEEERKEREQNVNSVVNVIIYILHIVSTPQRY